MRWILLGTLLAAFVDPMESSAQLLTPGSFRMVEVGSRVQIGISRSVSLAPNPRAARHVIGSVVAITPDTLYLEAPDTALAIARIQIASVEESLGVTRTGSALELGSTAATALVVLIPLINSGERRSDLHATALGASAGFALGTLIGALWPFELWRPGWIPE